MPKKYPQKKIGKIVFLAYWRCSRKGEKTSGQRPEASSCRVLMDWLTELRSVLQPEAAEIKKRG